MTLRARLRACCLIGILVVLVPCLPLAATAGDPATTGVEPITTQLSITARAANAFPQFRKYLFSFPLAAATGFAGLSGAASLASHGQAFAEALVSVWDVPAGRACPKKGEWYPSYPEVQAHYPGMQHLVSFIIKAPAGENAAGTPTTFRLPTAIPVSGCLVVILDGASFAGGPFTMTSNMAADLSKPPQIVPARASVGLDDEFCFGMNRGCQRHTPLSSPQASFMNVVRVTQPATLLALYGNVSASTFGGSATGSSGAAAWVAENDYYVYRGCSLAAGLSGPGDFYATIPADATKLYSLAMRGSGDASLQQPVFQAFTGVTLAPGDCLVHLARTDGVAGLGGVDAENQVFALVQPVEGAK